MKVDKRLFNLVCCNVCRHIEKQKTEEDLGKCCQFCALRIVYNDLCFYLYPDILPPEGALCALRYGSRLGYTYKIARFVKDKSGRFVFAQDAVFSRSSELPPISWALLKE